MDKETANALLADLPRYLGDGLVLRRGDADDLDALAALNYEIFDKEDHPQHGYVSAWTRVLMGDHPTVTPQDFTLVVDSENDGKPVSTANLISQTWATGGIAFAVGRPEIVGTLKAYRRKGLVRAQFEVLHAISTSKGHLMQAITGVPWYYRQFGYDMAMDLDGGRGMYDRHFPKLKKDESEPYVLRDATADDHGFIRELYERNRLNRTFVVVRDDAQWAYSLAPPDRLSAPADVFDIIERASDGARVGYVMRSSVLWAPMALVRDVVLRPDIGYLSVTPSVIRQAHSRAKALLDSEPDKHPAKEMYGVHFILGRDHPLYTAASYNLIRINTPYAWYIRIPDVIAYLTHIRAALTRRVQQHPLTAGFSGTLRLSMYRSGVQMVFEDGELTAIEDWQPEQTNDGDAKFPDLTFNQLLCGRRTVAELQVAFADCRATDWAAGLLDVMFPPFNGELWALS